MPNSKNPSAFDSRLNNLEKLLGSLDPDLIADPVALAEEIAANALASMPTASASIKHDASFTVRVSDDNMHVYLSISPAIGDGVRLTRALIIEELKRLKIEAALVNLVPISSTLIKSQTEEKAYDDVEIATGILPENGTDEQWEFLVEIPSKEVVFREDGSIDWRARGNIETVNSGDVIAKIITATEGVDGKDIFGNPIKAESGKSNMWQVGNNVEYDNMNNEIKATAKGILQIAKNVINVETTLVIHGNVDIAYGNVEFEGEVIIHGSVSSGFKVHAKGNITITGSIEAAEVISRAGNVYASTGIAGQGRAYVSANIGVYAKYIENAGIVNLI